MPDCNFPIDLVYLWVDGSDPAWCERKNKFLREAGAAEQSLAVPERWQDNNELLYSLRGVELFTPWIHHIYLITDSQRPSWLVPSHPRLTVVDHRDFIPQEYLPLFSSDTIETFVPDIPGLSEHFLLANDDIFFGRPLSPRRFFTAEGTPQMQVKRLYSRDFADDEALCQSLYQDNVFASRVRANRLVYERFGVKYNWEAAHVIDPYRKSFMQEVLSDPQLSSAWETARRQRFRSPLALQRIIFSLYDASKGRTKLLDTRRFRELKRLFCPSRLPLLLCKPADLAKVRRIRPEMFCYYVGDYYQELAEFFRSYFPQKSSFEK